MILSDGEITINVLGKDEGLSIDPFDMNMVQPASYDVKLSDTIGTFEYGAKSIIDIRDINTLPTIALHKIDEEPFIMNPGTFILASTHEKFRLPANIAGKVEGRSSLGRLGLQIHSTAGFIDPGFEGAITLELHNLSQAGITLYKNMKIAQIAFHWLKENATYPYGHEILDSKYQNSQGIGTSKIYADFKNN